MVRLLSRPGVLTSLVVAMSVVSGVAFGAAAMSAGLALHLARRRMSRT